MMWCGIQVHSRVEELLLSQGSIVEVDATDGPPSYDQATNGSTSQSTNDPNAMADATRLFYVEDGVQVKHGGGGQVSKLIYLVPMYHINSNNII